MRIRIFRVARAKPPSEDHAGEPCCAAAAASPTSRRANGDRPLRQPGRAPAENRSGLAQDGKRTRSKARSAGTIAARDALPARPICRRRMPARRNYRRRALPRQPAPAAAHGSRSPRSRSRPRVGENTGYGRCSRRSPWTRAAISLSKRSMMRSTGGQTCGKTCRNDVTTNERCRLEAMSTRSRVRRPRRVFRLPTAVSSL